jgi:hypothetical protein
MGEWISRRDIADACGATSSCMDAVLADIEAAGAPFVIMEDDQRPKRKYKALPRGTG